MSTDHLKMILRLLSVYNLIVFWAPLIIQNFIYNMYLLNKTHY